MMVCQCVVPSSLVTALNVIFIGSSLSLLSLGIAGVYKYWVYDSDSVVARISMSECVMAFWLSIISLVMVVTFFDWPRALSRHFTFLHYAASRGFFLIIIGSSVALIGSHFLLATLIGVIAFGLGVVSLVVAAPCFIIAQPPSAQDVKTRKIQTQDQGWRDHPNEEVDEEYGLEEDEATEKTHLLTVGVDPHHSHHPHKANGHGTDSSATSADRKRLAEVWKGDSTTSARKLNPQSSTYNPFAPETSSSSSSSARKSSSSTNQLGKGGSSSSSTKYPTAFPAGSGGSPVTGTTTLRSTRPGPRTPSLSAKEIVAQTVAVAAANDNAEAVVRQTVAAAAASDEALDSQDDLGHTNSSGSGSASGSGSGAGDNLNTINSLSSVKLREVPSDLLVVLHNQDAQDEEDLVQGVLPAQPKPSTKHVGGDGDSSSSSAVVQDEEVEEQGDDEEGEGDDAEGDGDNDEEEEAEEEEEDGQQQQILQEIPPQAGDGDDDDDEATGSEQDPSSIKEVIAVDPTVGVSGSSSSGAAAGGKANSELVSGSVQNVSNQVEATEDAGFDLIGSSLVAAEHRRLTSKGEFPPTIRSGSGTAINTKEIEEEEAEEEAEGDADEGEGEGDHQEEVDEIEKGEEEGEGDSGGEGDEQDENA